MADNLEHLNDPKKSGGPLVCTVICGGVLGYFFGTYWFNNPDQHPRSFDKQLDSLAPVNSTLSDYYYDCYAYPGGNAAAYVANNNTPAVDFGTANWGILIMDSNKEAIAGTVPNMDLQNSTGGDTPGLIMNDDGSALNPVPAFYQVNVTQNFIGWFAAGFILQMIAIGSAVISCIALALGSATLLKFSSGFIGCIQCIGGLGWFITGQVFRWQTSGMIGSGVQQVPADQTWETAKVANATTYIPFDEMPGTLTMSGQFIQVWLIIIYSLCGCCCLMACCAGVGAKMKS